MGGVTSRRYPYVLHAMLTQEGHFVSAKETHREEDDIMHDLVNSSSRYLINLHLQRWGP